MTVNPPPNADELVAEEDEISEPDEDSLAGQMALMKGQGVRRIGGDDDDTSGTEEESEGEESSEDESD